MDGQVAAYRSQPLAADDFAFIARRMRHIDEPGAYDLGGAAPTPGYRGPIAEDMADIGRRLRALESSRLPLPHPAKAADPDAEPDVDLWCC